MEENKELRVEPKEEEKKEEKKKEENKKESKKNKKKEDSNKKLKIAILILLLLLLLLLFTIIILIWRKQENGNRELADTIISDGHVSNDGFSPDKAVDHILFAGYSNIYATEDSPYILLENMEYNDVYFTYEVVREDTNEVILEETGLIQPGKAYPWNAKEVFDVGEYKVTFKIRTYEATEEQAEQTPVIMDNITLTIY